MTIKKFQGEYRFLSNFWPAFVILDNVWFNSVEHAYVAAKTLDPELRKVISEIEKPGDVKRFGRELRLRPDWEQVKYGIMLDLVRQKFTVNEFWLKGKLLETGDALIEEGNTWHDNYWGICRCEKCKGKGQNNLGKILMQVREELNENQGQEI